MGLFSWECRGCNKSILSPYSICKAGYVEAPDDDGRAGYTQMYDNGWMSDCVVVSEDGFVIMGVYDGYGRIETAEFTTDVTQGDPCMWHKACWLKAGKPGYDEPSVHSSDQGFFFEQREYDIPCPQ